jgi:hypothetical protein|uniref:Uncharacterized protein n=1 Tax=viral metagenome TaxID=1070528 RepID=A0A6C0C3B8_9ZZZZ
MAPTDLKVLNFGRKSLFFTSILLAILRQFFKWKYSEFLIYFLLLIIVLLINGFFLIFAFKNMDKLKILNTLSVLFGGLIIIIQLSIILYLMYSFGNYLFKVSDYPGYLNASIIFSFLMIIVQIKIFGKNTLKYINNENTNKMFTILSLLMLAGINIIPIQEMYNILINYKTDG